MKLTILGSGGCAVIPKPLCECRICAEAREKGAPYSRTGPSAFLHDGNILIDTPAEICWQLNQADIERVDYLLYTHLDPDHTEGGRVVEQIANNFRTWEGYPEKLIRLALPHSLKKDLEEHWNRSYDDYRELEKKHKGVVFAYDGLEITV